MEIWYVFIGEFGFGIDHDDEGVQVGYHSTIHNHITLLHKFW